MRILALALGLCAGFALAGGAHSADKIEVTADNFTVTDSERQAVFTGNVLVVHPDVTVKAQKVVVKYGDGGTSDVQTFDATGNVWLKTDEQEATGEHAIYDPATQILTLTGNVSVVNASGTVQGSALRVDMATQTSTFTSTQGGGRVKGVFSSQ